MMADPTVADALMEAMTVADHGIAAMERQLIRMGLPIDVLTRILFQHAASVLAVVESPVVRAEMMQTLIKNFPAQVQVAKIAMSTTKGGVIVPEGAKVQEPAGKEI